MFNSYEELMAAVEERRQGTLTLEIDMGGEYSQEYEDAKAELQQAKALKALAGEQQFLADNIEKLEARVAELKPAPNSIWVRYRRVPLAEWALLVKQQGMGAIEQYEKVLPKTFIALYGSDPEPEEDDRPEGWTEPEPLSTDAELLSSRSPRGILEGAMLHSVVQSFMSWQNSGGGVSIRPTRSGRD